MRAPERSSRRASSRLCFLGSLPSSANAKYDLSQAKSWLKKSGLGHPSIKLTYPTGITVNGLSFDDAAARSEQYLDQIGINVSLQPESLQVGLGSYRNGSEALGLWYWGPDYAGPAGLPGVRPWHLVGLRAGWPTSDSAADRTSRSGHRKAGRLDNRRHCPPGRFREVPKRHQQDTGRSSPSSSRLRSSSGPRTSRISRRTASGSWISATSARHRR